MWMFLFTMSISAQIGTIKGTIHDGKTNETMIGASVMIDGTSIGTTTDLDGNFELHNIEAGTYKLIISSIGYAEIVLEHLRVDTGKETIINTKMNEQ